MTELLKLVVRTDGTWDYRYAKGCTDKQTVELLRQIAQQIESGAHVKDPT